jgi:phosphoadenosine phosphosulfate reductase
MSEEKTIFGISQELRNKIAHSMQLIEESLKRFAKDEIYIAWTGGKDSTILLWLYRKTCQRLGRPLTKALFIDEGSVFEEVLNVVERVKARWDVDLTVVKNTDVMEKAERLGDIIMVSDLNQKNRKEIERIGFQDESFPFYPESFVGNHLMKTVALTDFINSKKVKAISTAIRWDEQNARSKERYYSPRSNPDHIRIHPILHFKERDIWDTIHAYGIPYCTLYAEGYRSLGAKGSTVKNDNIPAWEQSLEDTKERVGRGQDKEKIMEKLRDLGYM